MVFLCILISDHNTFRSQAMRFYVILFWGMHTPSQAV